MEEIECGKLYTVRESAEALRVHYKTALLWIEEGRLKASRIGRKYLIKGKDLQSLLERSKVEVW